MLIIIAQVLGVFAVATFLLSYQQKRRQNIIFLNVVSRVLYITQYLLLGAFSGAVLDIFGALSSVIAGKKQKGFVKRHTTLVMVSVNCCILAAGLSIAWINQSWLDLFSLTGVLLHTGAFWINDEKIIRRISLAGSPFWFVYNFLSRAYGSAVGDLLTMCSIMIAMIRLRDKASGKQEKNVA